MTDFKSLEKIEEHCRSEVRQSISEARKKLVGDEVFDVDDHIWDVTHEICFDELSIGNALRIMASVDPGLFENELESEPTEDTFEDSIKWAIWSAIIRVIRSEWGVDSG